jgi:tape measure domain-containing protein
MAVQRTGTHFTIKGLGAFISGLKKVNKEFRQMGVSASKMSEQVAKASERVAKASAKESKALIESSTAIERTGRVYTKLRKAKQDAIRGGQQQLDASLKREALAAKTSANAFTNYNLAIRKKNAVLKDSAKSSIRGQEAILKVSRASVTAAKASEAYRLAKEKRLETERKLQRAQEESIGDSSQLISAITAQGNAYDKVVSAQREVAEAGQELATAQAAAASSSKFAGVALAGVGIVLSGVAIGFGVLADAVRKVFGLLKKFGSFILQVVTGPLRFFARKMSEIATTALGILLRDSIRKVIDSLNRLKDAAINVISTFQTLEIRIQNLVARELRLTGQVDNVTASFKAAIKPAQELTSWISQLSLQVPFGVEQIANTTAFALAMGFTTGEAKSLTESIGNFAAGMGLASDKMESIIFNFGQMKAAGKVTGTEMRDLARGAFFPLTDVLDEAAKLMGVVADDMQEFRKQAAAGEVPIEAFFKAFQVVVERDFPEAMERMSRTLQGVTTRLKNFFKTVIGIELLGPVMKEVAGAASDALDKFLTPAAVRAAKVIGETLVFAFNRLRHVGSAIIDSIRKVAEAFGFTGFSVEKAIRVIANVTATLENIGYRIANIISGIAEDIGASFDDIAGNAKGWGANIVNSLAEGMATAAKAVVSVLIQLGNLIASWLRPGSPPRLLPKLDQWGAEAMTVYMEGWLNADFGAFNQIADKIESFIRSLTEEFLKQKNVIPVILEVRDALAKAFNEIKKNGEASANTIKRIFSALKSATPALKEYTRLLIELAKAESIVEKAQKALNDTIEKYDKILDPLKRRLDQLTDATQDFDDSRRASQLQLILTDVNASEGDKERARLELERLELEGKIRAVENEKDVAVDAAQLKLTAAEKARDALAEELAVQENLVDVQIKTNELIKEQIALLESLKKAGSGGIDPEQFDFGFGIPEEDMIERIRGLLKRGRGFNLKDIFDQAREEASDAVDDILEKFDGLGEQLEELGAIWGGIFGVIFGDAGNVIGGDEFRKHGPGDTDEPSKLLQVWNDITDAVRLFFEILEPKIVFFNTSLRVLTRSFESFGKAFDTGEDGPITFFDLLAIAVGHTVAGFTFWYGVLALSIALMLKVVETINNLRDGFNNLGASLGEGQQQMADAVALFFANMWEGMVEAWENIKIWFSEELPLFIAKIPEKFREMYDAGIDFLTELWKGFILVIGLINPWWAEQLQATVDKIGEYLQLMYDAAVLLFTSIYNGMKDFWDETLLPWFEALFIGENSIVQLVLDQYDKMLAAGKKIINGLWEGMKEIWAKLVVWVEENFGWLIEILDSIAGNSSPSKVMKDTGKNIMLGLAEGLESGADAVREVMENVKDGLETVDLSAEFSGVSIGDMGVQSELIGDNTTTSFFLESINAQMEQSTVLAQQSVALLTAISNGIDSISVAAIASPAVMSPSVSMSDVAGPGDTNNTLNNNFTLNMPTTASPASVERAFGVMRLMSE